MTIAAAFFVVGYLFRKRNLMAHRILMSLGVIATVLAALVLLYFVHVVHGSDIVAAGFVPLVPEWGVLIHRGVATIVFLIMFAMVWTGATRRREYHIKLHRIFLPGYLLVYVSGLLIFGGSSQ